MKRKSNKHNPTVKQELENAYQEFKASLAQRPVDGDRTAKSFLTLAKKIQKHVLEYERRTFIMGSDWNDKEKKALMDAKDAAVKIHEVIGRENAGWFASRYFTNFRVPRPYADESVTRPQLPKASMSSCIESPVSFVVSSTDKSITRGYYVEDSLYDDDEEDENEDCDVAKKNDIVMDLDSVSNMGEALESKCGSDDEDDDVSMCCDGSASNLNGDVSMDICANGSGPKRPTSVDTGSLGKRPDTSLPWDEMVADMAEPNRLKLKEFGEKIDRGAPYWNGEIQALLERQCKTPEEYLERADGIMGLYERFCDAALAFFKKGIVKYYASGESISNSGVAGGVKFKEGNIFFKLCVYDEKMARNTYEDDIEVMKAANLEIQGLSKYMSCDIEGLYFPMMAVLDYMGFRVVASSVLPVSQNKSSGASTPGANNPRAKISDTIVYGTENGGKDYFFCEKANSLARSTASILGIKEHEVKGIVDGEVRKLWTAADTEINYGYDGKLYMLDTARYMPTEPIQKAFVKGWKLCYLLRPEMVQCIGPQNPDYATGFGHFPSEDAKQKEFKELHERFEEERRRAIQELYLTFDNRIGEGSRRAVSVSNYELWKELGLKDAMHKRGLNMRSLYMFHDVALRNNSLILSTIVATEVVARRIKWELRKLMRDHVKAAIRGGNEEPWGEDMGFCRMLAAGINAKVSMACFQSVREKFLVDPDMLLRRLNDMLSLGLGEDVLSAGVVGADSLRGYASSKPQVKRMSLLSFEEGVSLYHRTYAAYSEYVTRENLPHVHSVISAFREYPAGAEMGVVADCSRLDAFCNGFGHAAQLMSRAASSGRGSFRLKSYLVKTFQERAKICVYAGKFVDAWKHLEQADSEVAPLENTGDMTVDKGYVVSTRRDIYELLVMLSECRCLRETTVVKNFEKAYKEAEKSFYESMAKSSSCLATLESTYRKLEDVMSKKWFFGEYETRSMSALDLQPGKNHFIIRTSPKHLGAFVLTTFDYRPEMRCFEKNDYDITACRDGMYSFCGRKYDSIPQIIAETMTKYEIKIK